MNFDNVFDIDGTLTIPGFDLWFLTTKILAKDKVSQFVSLVEDWKTTSASQEIIESSRIMMNSGLTLFHYKEDEVRKVCFNLTRDLFLSDKVIRLSAINLIKQQLSNGETVHFSTANYRDAAIGFLDALVDLKLISVDDASKITVDGSVVEVLDGRATVSHINVAENKTHNFTSLKNAYGDDPMGNDRGLAALAEKFYIIDTPKNQSVDEYERLSWG